MKNWIIALMALAVLIGGWEAYSKSALSKDKETYTAVMGVIIAKLCPEMPAAMSVARKRLLHLAVTKPHHLPPWQLARILWTPADAQDLAGNPFPKIACKMIVDNG